MNKKIGILATSILSLALLLTNIHEAEAKRMGGGSSFGSKPSYSTPYQRSSPSSTPYSQPQRSPAQQQAATQNQGARQNWANRGGLMGMLGGLALGGLLGSLFFGGAFEGLNLMDMLLFAGIAYLLYRLLASRARQAQPMAKTPYGVSTPSTATPYQRDSLDQDNRNSGFNTDVMFGKGKGGEAFNAGSYNQPLNVPANFDQAGFLRGAESAYRFLQEAWDKRDLAAIRGLTTDKVFAELQDQLRATPAANKTDVLKVNTELLEVREVGSELEATVLFDCVLREDDGPSGQVREVWHFIKPVNSQQPKWFLDGIQQLEN
ncbi:MAG: hypothetical protein RL563_844 [Pseudomonadota bacterium]|jgi:predicted lipid-binding transport protein (Tim44 family)